jgi:hypothetical protein
MTGGPLHGSTTSIVVAPGDLAYLAFADPRPQTDRSIAAFADRPGGALSTFEAKAINRLELNVRYSDISGERWSKTRVRFFFGSENSFETGSIEIEPS